MSNKSRGVLKISYYIIGIIIVIFYTSNFSSLLGELFAIYIILGSVLSCSLKLPLFSRFYLYKVDKKYYGSIDTFCNILFFIIATILLIYLSFHNSQ